MGQRIRASTPFQADRAGLSKGWLLLLLLLAAAGVAIWLWQSPQALQQVLQTAQTAIDRSPFQSTTQSVGGGAGANAAPDGAEELANSQAPGLPSADSVDAQTALQPLDENAPTDWLSQESPTEPVNPIEPVAIAEQAPLPSLDASDAEVSATVSDWVGQQQSRAMLRNDSLIRRVVATVDNLPRERAPTNSWPVHPTSPRFTVRESDSGTDTHIAPENSARYAAAIALLQGTDPTVAANYYKKYYPLFQQAYEDLGYPNRYFNDRLVFVIDHLLQTPEPVAPRVRSALHKNADSRAPWAHYEFEDPGLEARSAGQKILIRIGPENAREVKTALRALRAEIAGLGNGAARGSASTPPGA